MNKTGRRRTEPKTDALPEFYNYRDDGCDVSPSCLRCPLAVCKYDDPLAYQWAKREARYAPARELLAQGATIREVAKEMRVSERTVARLKAVAR